VIGTRPEAIKMVPVIRALEASTWARCVVVATAQHREMLDQMLQRFNVVVDYDLNLMQANQGLNQLLACMLPELDNIIKKEKPYALIAQGDTTTVFGSALAAFNAQIPFGHVEAGLRTYNLKHPFPEEGYRQMISKIAHWNFAPTELAANTLIKEGVLKEKVFVTGNTCIDTLLMAVNQLPPVNKTQEKIIVLTVHRREIFGQPLENVFKTILKILEDFKNVKVIYPVHPNPHVKNLAHSLLVHPRIILKDPLNYFDFVDLLRQADLILTDSGGIQEEAPALGKPVFVIRETTERPEPISAGRAKLVGTNEDYIYHQVSSLLLNEDLYREMAKPYFPYGNGDAAKKIISILQAELEV